MSARLQQIADRRRALLALADEQRLGLLVWVRPWQLRASTATRALSIGMLGRYPLWLWVSAGAIGALPSGRPQRWLRRFWIAGYALFVVLKRTDPV